MTCRTLDDEAVAVVVRSESGRDHVFADLPRLLRHALPAMNGPIAASVSAENTLLAPALAADARMWFRHPGTLSRRTLRSAGARLLDGHVPVCPHFLGASPSTFVSELLGTGLWRTEVGRSDSSGFGGTDRRWATSECAHPFLAVSGSRSANPVVLVDEVERAGVGRSNGRLRNFFPAFPKRETARCHPDPKSQADTDLSHISYVISRNGMDGLPAALRNRCRVVEDPVPSSYHLGSLLPSLVRHVARQEQSDERWIEPLTMAERAMVAKHRHSGSIRHLGHLVGAVLRGRARHHAFH